MKHLFLFSSITALLFGCTMQENEEHNTIISEQTDTCEWSGEPGFFPLTTGTWWNYRYEEFTDLPIITTSGWSMDGVADEKRIGKHCYTILTDNGQTYSCRFEANDSVFKKDSSGAFVFTKDSLYSDTFEISIENNRIVSGGSYGQLFINTGSSGLINPENASVSYQNSKVCVGYDDFSGSSERHSSLYVHNVGLVYHHQAPGSHRYGFTIPETSRTLTLESYNDVPFDVKAIKDNL